MSRGRREINKHCAREGRKKEEGGRRRMSTNMWKGRDLSLDVK